MAKEVYMPALGMNQETGTLLRWLKREGDEVRKGEPLMEIATDKTDVEIEAPASGILCNVAAVEGDEVPVGQVIALIAAAEEAAALRRSPQPRTTAPATLTPSVTPTPVGSPKASVSGAVPISPLAARVAAEHGVDLSQVKPAGSRIQKEDVLAFLAGQRPISAPLQIGRVLASPKARRLARENGLDLAALSGSGPEGAVLAADVLRAQAAPVVAVPQPQPVPAAEPASDLAETLPMSRMWKVMADRLAQSWASVPHFYLERDVDATRLAAWRNQTEQDTGLKITYTDLLIKLVAAALHRHPRLNAAWRDGAILANAAANIGLAVAVEEGLLVPVIHNAGTLGVREIHTRRGDLVQRAQKGALAPADLSGGTFTISNLGMFGIDRFNAIVNPPQAAILAVGRIADRIVALEGQPVVRLMLTLTISCDHRIVDGARAAQFLATLATLIEEPLRLLD
jgi:pyruvate dehydrogenase E2 component (dihydrolipoamide acetyltransferase)